MSSSSSPTVVSSPGKVLLAGGYLVLDPAYSGVVVSTSSRFYTVVDPISAPPVHASASDGPIQIRVRSPQFLDATWLYFVEFDGPDIVRVEQVADNTHSASTKNKFVHLALQRTLSLATELKSAGTLQNTLSHGLDITIVGDNDFYSQRAQLNAQNLPPTLESLAKLPHFNKTGVRLPDVHKTGLGSSAALITSLVSGLLLHLGVIPSDSFATEGGTDTASEGRKLAHNLSQYVHCLAQGKVGSGFDVSAAVFGSQLYTRFDPAVIAPLMTDATSNEPLHPVVSPSNSAWNYRVEPFKLPPQTRLMLADVDAGSDTPSLVGKVLKWRKENAADAKALWDTIDALNQSLARTLSALTDAEERNPTAYRKAVKYISTIQSLQWLANPRITENDSVADFRKVIEAFVEVNQITEDIRAKMREMGKLSDVPIEPPEQTALLDACVSVAGVIGGGVPGAGGYDAVWLLVCDPLNCAHEELPSARVERMWSTYKGLDVSPLLAVESAAKGVRVEQLPEVVGLEAIVREE
ncbi:Phosphomevalonate kinase [Daedaleopsis nitida]|nr:Phosphomevalonate kinase [Daedaleopsis nitida]